MILSNCAICGKKKLTCIKSKKSADLMINLKRIISLTNVY